MKTKKITCAELLELVSDEMLDRIAQETQVNYQVKKLTGQTLFKLILYSNLETERLSQRTMEETFCSYEFNFFSNENSKQIDHSSICKRLSKVNFKYFEKIFFDLSKKLEIKDIQLTNRKKVSISIFDSTLVSISSKLLETEINNYDKSPKNGIKFTTEVHNGLFVNSKIFTEKSYNSEDVALRDVILKSQYSKDSIVTFDRGLKKRETFKEFNDEGITFVSRVNTDVSYETVKKYKNIKGRKTETLELKEDLIVNLKTKENKKVKLRMIKAIKLDNREKIIFITNTFDFNAAEVTKIYKSRWHIEVLFKFIKQELSFSHLVSRNLNGIKVMLYMTFITAILLTSYKIQNNLKGYKIVKMKFKNELILEIIKDAIIFCNGDLSKFDRWKYRLRI